MLGNSAYWAVPFTVGELLSVRWVKGYGGHEEFWLPKGIPFLVGREFIKVKFRIY
jgi:hypothetical protein